MSRAACCSVLLGLVLAGCGDGARELPAGTCRAVVWGVPERAGGKVSVIGSWDDWDEPTQLRRFEISPWHVAELALTPGEYGYLLVEDGQARRDPTAPLSDYRESDGHEVSFLHVDDCTHTRLVVEDLQVDGAGAELRVRAVLGDDTVSVDGLSVREAGIELAAAVAEDHDGWRVRVSGLTRGRHRLELAAEGSEPAIAIAWVEPVAATPADAIIYQIVVDRFRDPAGDALAPPVSPGLRAGGSLDGVTRALEDGYFDDFGVSTLWLSPIYVNPNAARPDSIGHVFEGYHGYWPVDTRRVDDRIGGDAALDRLMASAHARGIAVLLDLVPNHYDIENPRVAANRTDGWFNERDPVCVCGAADCPWSTEIETCWFTPYLADVRFQHRDALRAAVEDALWLHERYGGDGFRVDAVPMMPRAATRRIAATLRAAAVPKGGAWLLGEIFTGPGAGGVEAIRYHLGPNGLDSAFDFPVMWAIRDAVGGRAGFDVLARLLADQDAALAGSGATMARMLGNHDTTRIASFFAGDDGADPWSAAPAQSTDAEVFARMRLAHALVLTLPGAPVIYYGDEVGLAGARDPDSRRVMPDDADLQPAQLALRGDVMRLAALRRCSAALRSANWALVGATVDHLAFTRDDGAGNAVIVVASRSDVATHVELPGGLAAGWYKDAMSEATVKVGVDGTSLDLEPLGVRVLMIQGDRCGSPS